MTPERLQEFRDRLDGYGFLSFENAREALNDLTTVTKERDAALQEQEDIGTLLSKQVRKLQTRLRETEQHRNNAEAKVAELQVKLTERISDICARCITVPAYKQRIVELQDEVNRWKQTVEATVLECKVKMDDERTAFARLEVLYEEKVAEIEKLKAEYLASEAKHFDALTAAKNARCKVCHDAGYQDGADSAKAEIEKLKSQLRWEKPDHSKGFWKWEMLK